MAFFFAIFLFVALVLIGIGIVIGLIGCAITAGLFAIGILSSSVAVGMLTRRPAAGVRAFIFQCAVLAGIPAGVLCAWLAHSILEAVGPEWLIFVYGGLGGAVAGLVVAVMLDFTFRRAHRWANARLGRNGRAEIVTNAA